jgi:PhnO protein
MSITVRKAWLTDAEAVYHFICALEKTILDRDRFLSFYARNIQDERNHYLVALVDDIVVGFLSCHGQYLLHHLDTVYEIQELYVEEAYRSKGIGQALMDALEDWLKGQQYDVLEVSSNAARTRAHLFYERNGFVNTHLKFVRKNTRRHNGK